MNHLKNLRLFSSLLVCFSLCLSTLALSTLCVSRTWANPSKETKPVAEKAATATAKAATAAPAKPKVLPFAVLLKGSKPVKGLFSMWRKDQHLFAELSAGNYNKDYIVLISIARGIGQGVIMPGMTWKSGDEWVWQLRKVDNRVHVVRRNLRFRARKGSPQSTAVENAYTDSILFSLPIITKGPSGGDLVDLSTIFFSDLPQISQALPGFAFSKARSTWSAVKAFKDNVELEVAATYASSGKKNFISVPDSRALTINVHYSISKIPNTGYKPRLADERIGYFVTAVMDYSKPTFNDRFIRYLERWNLQKADPAAKVSPPKKPIVFWIEKTVPFKYRKPIREGILEWNKAFEKAGFVNAIEVRQQPNEATWDPEDIHYNTIRWITAGAGIAYGPSRVNPLTGEILDADILIDADFMHYPHELFNTFDGKSISALAKGVPDSAVKSPKRFLRHSPDCNCQMHLGFSRDLALGSAVMAKAGHAEELERLILEGLKWVTMHEVGHTLGLRHNFKASTLHSIQDLNNPEKVRESGFVGSVMEYVTANLVTKDMKQGDYYPKTLGPYDYWAIEYGYKTLAGKEKDALAKIASRSAEPALAYASDEDTRADDPDPLVNRFDLGKDPVEFARFRAKLVEERIPGLVDRVTKPGESYAQARRSFGILLSSYGNAMYFASRTIGGVHVNRAHKGDPGAKPPTVVVDAKTQREALQLLEEKMFSAKPFAFSPELYNHLASPRWIHWGSKLSDRPDFPVHRVILVWQDYIVAQLFASSTLTRLHDSELKISPDKDAFTTAELIRRLTRSIFSEVDELKAGEYTNRKPAINSLRRNFQRRYLKRVSLLALGQSSAPQDCQTVAYAELAALSKRLKNLLDRDLKLDDYSRAHLEESNARIQKVLEARLQLSQP